MLIRGVLFRIAIALLPLHSSATQATLNSVVITPSAATTGTTPSSIKLLITPNEALETASLHVITITSTQTTWTWGAAGSWPGSQFWNQGTLTSPSKDVIVKKEGADITNWFTIQPQSATSITLTLRGVPPVTPGGEDIDDSMQLEIDFIENTATPADTRIAALGAAGTVNIFSVTTSVDTTASATVTGWTVGAAAVAGDPLTFWNGEKIKFWFPLQTLLPLLVTPDMRMLASVFQGPSEDYQWFDRFVFTLPDGNVFADIRVKRQSRTANATATRHGFQQLEIFLGNDAKPLRTLPKPSLYYTVPGTRVRIAVETRPFNPPRRHGSPYELMEYVHIESESLSFLVHSSHAGTDFPNDIHMQTKYEHLDWTGLDMRGLNSFTGILPQLWGVAPMTEDVSAMRTAPSKRTTPLLASDLPAMASSKISVCSEKSRSCGFKD